MLGLNPQAPRAKGYVKGGLLRQFRSPKSTVDEMDQLWKFSTPWKETSGRKDFAQERKRAKSLKNVVHYTEYDEYYNPEIIESREAFTSQPDFLLGKYQLPRWADLQGIVLEGLSCGRTTKGRYPRKAAQEMLNHLLARNPIDSWLTGGYTIESYFYRDPGLTGLNLLLYESLRRTTIGNFPSVNKREGKDAILHMRDGSGHQFLKDLGIALDSSNDEEESILSTPEEEIEYDETDDDSFGLEDDDVSIAYFNESDDDDSIIIQDDIE